MIRAGLTREEAAQGFWCISGQCKGLVHTLLTEEWRSYHLWIWLEGLSAVWISFLPMCRDLLGNLNFGGFNGMQWRFVIHFQWLVKGGTISCSTQVLYVQHAVITYIKPRDGSVQSTPSVGMFQARKVFFLAWRPKSGKDQVGNNSNTTKYHGWGEISKLFACQYTESWAAACPANIWRNELQGLGLIFLMAQKMFSVTLIKIRKKKKSSHWNLQEKIFPTI